MWHVLPTEDFNNRETYHEVPKNHLTAFNVADSNFVTGMLEDWTRGALQFDGSSVYCSIDHEAASATRSNNVDMALNDFIIEAYIKPDTGHTGGIIVSKYSGSAGYQLDINELGQARISLFETGSVKISASSSVAVNEGGWHHLLAEIRRSSDIHLFVDGVLSNGNMTGEMPAAEVSLSNSADLLVGKNMDNFYFNGTLDFLRLSRGNLFDARTTIDELFQWQSDGPFLYDLTGKAPTGKRDAGVVSSGDSVYIHVDQNLSGLEREAEVRIESCQGIHPIKVVQDTIPVHTGEFNAGDISIYPNPVTEQQIRIIVPGGAKGLDYTISDLSGKALQDGKLFSSEEVILLKVQPGSYFLSIKGDELSFKKVLIVL